MDPMGYIYALYPQTSTKSRRVKSAGAWKQKGRWWGRDLFDVEEMIKNTGG